jgi:hypothetical protein
MKLTDVMSLAEHERTGAGRLSEPQREALVEWGMRMFGLGQHVVARIEKIKHEGRVLVLDDGTRWDVEAADGRVAELWVEGNRVVVIEGQMYKLDDSERVGVEQDYG